MKKVYTIIFCALTLLIVATGCNYDKIDNFKSKKQPVSIKNFIMGEETYEKLTVQLVLTKGEYFDIDHTIPSGGVYEENYQGNYVLKVLKNKEVLSSAISAKYLLQKVKMKMIILWNLNMITI